MLDQVSTAPLQTWFTSRLVTRCVPDRYGKGRKGGSGGAQEAVQPAAGSTGRNGRHPTPQPASRPLEASQRPCRHRAHACRSPVIYFRCWNSYYLHGLYFIRSCGSGSYVHIPYMVAYRRRIIFVHGIADIDRGITFVPVNQQASLVAKGPVTGSPASGTPHRCYAIAPALTRQKRDVHRKGFGPRTWPAFFGMLVRTTAENWVDYESPTAQEACR